MKNMFLFFFWIIQQILLAHIYCIYYVVIRFCFLIEQNTEQNEDNELSLSHSPCLFVCLFVLKDLTLNSHSSLVIIIILIIKHTEREREEKGENKFIIIHHCTVEKKMTKINKPKNEKKTKDD